MWQSLHYYIVHFFIPLTFHKKIPALFHETFLSSRPAEQKREIQGSFLLILILLSGEKRRSGGGKNFIKGLFCSPPPPLSRMEKSKKSGRELFRIFFLFFLSPSSLGPFLGAVVVLSREKERGVDFFFGVLLCYISCFFIQDSH